MLVYSAACEYVRNVTYRDMSSGYMVKDRCSYITTAPVCLHGIGGNNITYGKGDSINIFNIIRNAGLCSEMLIHLLCMF